MTTSLVGSWAGGGGEGFGGAARWSGIGRLIDEHMRPTIVATTRPMQSPSQYGFTEKVTYLMGALQRHECEKFCLDMKKTFFGCSLDGDSAFEVVNKVIQTRELYMSGVKGDYWQASNYSYQDSLTKIKMNGNLSEEFNEQRGVKQGSIKSGDHYKIYVAPIVEFIDQSQLGVQIGPTTVQSAHAKMIYY